MRKNSLPRREAIAREFALGLLRYLGSRKLKMAVRRNHREKQYPQVCHTHDFCDANVMMIEAFKKVVGREPDPRDDADNGVWTDAWQLAKENNFWLGGSCE